MDRYGTYVDVLGVSADSFVPATNARIGRGGDANNRHAQRALRVRELCSKHDILFKLNTVVNAHNLEEDMNAKITLLDPFRWKVRVFRSLDVSVGVGWAVFRFRWKVHQ